MMVQDVRFENGAQCGIQIDYIFGSLLQVGYEYEFETPIVFETGGILHLNMVSMIPIFYNCSSKVIVSSCGQVLTLVWESVIFPMCED